LELRGWSVCEFVENPAVFGGDLFFHGALEVSRENPPSVSFDFEVVASAGVPFAPGEGFSDVVIGRFQGGGGCGVEGDVEMDAGFLKIGGSGFAGIEGSKEDGQVEEALKGVVRAAGYNLVEVGGFVKFAYRFDGCRIPRIERKGVGKVDFREADAPVGINRIERSSGIVEFDGEVAGIKIQSDPLAEDGGAASLFIQAFEE